MPLFDPVFAVQFTHTEQVLIGAVLLASAFLGGLGFLCYKLLHVLEPLMGSYFKVLSTYERERAKFKQLQQELRSGSQRVPDPVPKP